MDDTRVSHHAKKGSFPSSVFKMSPSQQNSVQKWAVGVLHWHNQLEDTWLDNEEDRFDMWKLRIPTKSLFLNTAKYLIKHPKSKERENSELKTTGCIASFSFYFEEYPSLLR